MARFNRTVRDLLASEPTSDLTDADLLTRYADLPADRAWLRLNMVATVDGSATGADGLSGSINTGADHRVFGLLRAWADVVLVGAGTVQAEKYGAARTEPEWAGLRAGRDPHPAMAVVTSHALPDDFDATGGGPVFTVQGPLPQIVDGLHERGYRHVLAEGGPTLAAGLVAAGLVDEFCLTTSPLVVAGDGGRIMHGEQSATRLDLAGLLEENGTLLARWRRAG